MISEHLENFAGLPVREFDPEQRLDAPAESAWRLSISYDEQEEQKTICDKLAAFLADLGAKQVEALVIGCWEEAGQGHDSSEIVEALVSGRDRIPNLLALFLGDITYEESEISWINQSDISPLFTAFPKLEVLGIRGGNGLSLGRPRHNALRQLSIQSGGLPASVVREVGTAQLPALEHLELWLGDDGYGNDVTPADLAPILSGKLFPRLRYLGLRDDAHADVTAAALATAPIVAMIETLDLSMGTLGDEGAEALFKSPSIKKLKKLDLHRHYLSNAMMDKLRKLGPTVDVEDQQTPENESDRYVEVSE
ncbi:MAG TPA: STM4015 family protein [Planctomycetaceae bacterium]